MTLIRLSVIVMISTKKLKSGQIWSETLGGSSMDYE